MRRILRLFYALDEVLIMPENTIQRNSPFRLRRAIQYNDRSSPFEQLIPASRAVTPRYNLEQTVTTHLLY